MSRRHPAEWEPQRAVWLAWPHNAREWREERLPGIRDFFHRLIDVILDFQDVRLVLAREDMRADIAPILKGRSRRFTCEPVVIPNNDIWIRDYGPFFVETADGAGTSRPLALDFGFNAWGGKYPPWDLDDAFAPKAAAHAGVESETRRMILEGGAVDFSGDGLILTTEQCLLNHNRNPSMTRADIESEMCNAFGAESVIWLHQGLEGDHTDGHVDDITRFIGPRTVVTCVCDDRNDENFGRLAENRELLRRWRHPRDGTSLAIIELPMPRRMDIGADRLPNSYANFIFVNGGLIVSRFDCATDDAAMDALKRVFPDRRVVSIDSTLLIEEGGGLHCMTRQEPGKI